MKRSEKKNLRDLKIVNVQTNFNVPGLKKAEMLNKYFELYTWASCA